MKCLLFILCFSIPLMSFSQKGLIDSINKLVGPVYAISADSIPAYEKVDIDNDGVKEIVISANNTSDTDEVINKIFVLAHKHGNLYILDSSAPYLIDGRGPSLEIKGAELTLVHSFHRGGNSVTFRFNVTTKKYILASVSTSYVDPRPPSQKYTFEFEQVYDVNSQTLNLKSTFTPFEESDKYKEKKRTIHKKLPEDLPLKLSELKDPGDYDAFINDGPVYKEMMKY